MNAATAYRLLEADRLAGLTDDWPEQLRCAPGAIAIVGFAILAQRLAECESAEDILAACDHGTTLVSCGVRSMDDLTLASRHVLEFFEASETDRLVARHN